VDFEHATRVVDHPRGVGKDRFALRRLEDE
jgi:hypothetical protein